MREEVAHLATDNCLERMREAGRERGIPPYKDVVFVELTTTTYAYYCTVYCSSSLGMSYSVSRGEKTNKAIILC